MFGRLLAGLFFFIAVMFGFMIGLVRNFLANPISWLSSYWHIFLMFAVGIGLIIVDSRRQRARLR